MGHLIAHIKSLLFLGGSEKVGGVPTFDLLGEDVGSGGVVGDLPILTGMSTHDVSLLALDQGSLDVCM